MKRGTVSLLAALGMTALVAAGCANKEVVKTEEPVKAATVAPEPAKPEAPKAAEQPMAEQPKAEMAKPMEEAKAAAPMAAFESIYFDFDKSDLRPDARDVLNKNAEALKANSDLKIKIEGNCDERGSAEYNLALGERRAKSAMQYLVTLGIPADRLSTISYGKEKANAEAKDEAAWAKDRRDDFVIVK